MRLRSQESGDTLVEVVLSIAILSVVLVSAFNIANLTFRVGVQARERTEAGFIAQKHAEIMTASRDVALESNTDPTVLLFSTASPAGGNFGSRTFSEGPNNRYNVAIATNPVTRDDGTASTPMLATSINVSWDSIIPGPPPNRNQSIVRVNMADLRSLQAIDCSVKGENPLCTLSAPPPAPTPPAPPPAGFINGSDWTTCVGTQAPPVPAFDGCANNGTSTSAWREFIAVYDMSPLAVPAGNRQVEIKYTQVNGQVPGGYRFNVSLRILDAGGVVISAFPLLLDPGGGPPYTQQTLTTGALAMPANARLELQWTNDFFAGPNDSNLQINTLRIY